MNYEFKRSSAGPVLVSEDEVLLFKDFAQLQDYADYDPEFFNKARDFVAESIRELSDLLINSMYGPVVGEELAGALPEYITSMYQLRSFESRYLEISQKYSRQNSQV